MFSKEINVKASDVPPGWSLEAADFINKLLKKKSKERLGKGGIIELKDHSWLKGIQWQDIYKKEVYTPFIPPDGENYDSNYCNKVDVVDKMKYEYFLNKINNLKLFKHYYFNYYIENQEIYYEQDNVAYKFTNIHEEGSTATSGRNVHMKSFGATIINLLKSENNNLNISQSINLNNTNLTHRKLKKGTM